MHATLTDSSVSTSCVTRLQGCATCLVDGGNDGAAHDVQSGNVIEASLKFDTPWLRYSRGTAPYFQNFRYLAATCFGGEARPVCSASVADKGGAVTDRVGPVNDSVRPSDRPPAKSRTLGQAAPGHASRLGTKERSHVGNVVLVLVHSEVEATGAEPPS